MGKLKLIEREYIVTLKKDVDYEKFNEEMIQSTGAGAIPKRTVDVANARPGSKRNTHYALTEAEVIQLRKDSRAKRVAPSTTPLSSRNQAAVPSMLKLMPLLPIRLRLMLSPSSRDGRAISTVARQQSNRGNSPSAGTKAPKKASR